MREIVTKRFLLAEIEALEKCLRTARKSLKATKFDAEAVERLSEHVVDCSEAVYWLCYSAEEIASAPSQKEGRKD